MQTITKRKRIAIVCDSGEYIYTHIWTPPPLSPLRCPQPITVAKLELESTQFAPHFIYQTLDRVSLAVMLKANLRVNEFGHIYIFHDAESTFNWNIHS